MSIFGLLSNNRRQCTLLLYKFTEWNRCATNSAEDAVSDCYSLVIAVVIFTFVISSVEEVMFAVLKLQEQCSW